MSFTKITSADTTNKGVVGLQNRPGYSTLQMQEKLDELALNVIVPKFNALSGELDGVLSVNEITIPSDAWVSNSHATYTKKAVIESTLFSDTFIPTAVDMIPSDGTEFFSEAEEEALDLLNPNCKFTDSDVTFYATDEPTTALKFRIRGGN